MKKERTKKPTKKLKKKIEKKKKEHEKRLFLKIVFATPTVIVFSTYVLVIQQHPPMPPMPPYTCPPISRLFLKRPPWPPLSPLPKGMLIQLLAYP